MANIKVKTIKPFSYIDSNGIPRSPRDGAILEVAQATGEAWISAGLAEAYTLITPTGAKSITENGEGIDVKDYATANVNVPNPSTGALEVDSNGTYDVTEKASVVINVPAVKLTYNKNGGTGSVSPVSVGKGTAVTLSDGTGLTPPEDKIFGGWATTDSAETPDVVSPLTVTADTTIYAVWVSAS